MGKTYTVPKLCKKCVYCKSVDPMHTVNGQPLSIPVEQAIAMQLPVITYDYKCELKDLYLLDIKIKNCKVNQIIEGDANE